MLKKLLILISLVPFGLALASCGDSNGNGEQTPTPPGNGSSNSAALNVEATFHLIGPNDSAWGDYYIWNDIIFLINENANIASIRSSNVTISSNLDLPTTVNGVPLVTIASSSLENRNIEAVNFNRMHYLRQIANGAFRNNDISEIELSNLENLEYIRHGAFSENPISLITLYRLPSLGNISNSAFENLGEVSGVRTLQIRNHLTWQTSATQTWLADTSTAFPNFSRINI